MLFNVSNLHLLEQLGATSGPFAIKDLEHRYVHANDAFCSLIGVAPDDLTGRNDLELGRSELLVLGDPATDWPGLWHLDEQALAKGESMRTGIRYGEKTGAVDTVRTPLQDDQGRTVALLVQLHDARELRELQQRVATNTDALKSRDVDFMTLDSVLTSMLACRDTETLLTRLADTLVTHTQADGAYVAVMHECEEFMEVIVGAGNRSAELVGTRFTRNEGLVGRAWHVGESIYLDDVTELRTLHPYPKGTQAFALPLHADDTIVAALCVLADPGSEDLSQKVPLLERICAMASMALANTRLIESTRQGLKRARALSQISQLLNTSEDEDFICDAVCHMMLSAVEASRTSCYLLDSNGDPYPHVSWGDDDGAASRISSFPRELIKGSIVQWTLDNDRQAVIERLAEDPRESADMHAARQAMNIGSTCCLSLKKQGKVMGSMIITRQREKCDFNESEIAFFKSVVNQLATAIERSLLAREINHLAYHDGLTHLPNRRNFERRLDAELAHATDADARLAVMFIDLDGFKGVNDSQGHAAGDELLIKVTQRLSGCLDGIDTLARMGGDEFSLILREPDADRALVLADELLTAVARDFNIDGQVINIGASIGISRFPDHGDTPDQLLRHADTAMYDAKRCGKGCVVTFAQAPVMTTTGSGLLEQQLAEAIERQQLRLVYQPQIRCSDSRVVGLEALIRWAHPDRGLLAPQEFIPLAEATGLIHSIGAWVVDEALRQLAVWQSTSLDGLRMCINVAASQFELDAFCDLVLNALQRHGVSASLLELEVTESVLMHDVSSVVSRLTRLRDAGVRIAVDDFGTGYSSLAYLQNLPLDVLKIDRTFISRLSEQCNDPSIVKLLLLLAANLGLETVAEGVELPEQRNQVETLGFDALQGFLYSRPVAAGDVPAAIKQIESRLPTTLELRKAA